MNNATRILIVEDLPGDYELAQREIRKAVKQCTFKRVEKQDEFLTALDEFQPDLILSDYRLPGFDGIKVLKLAQKHSPPVPVVIWTGVMGETVAVKCLKNGASNYVLKNDLKHLKQAILRAREERYALLKNKQIEEKYQAIFENAMEGIFQSTPEGRYLRVNPAMARIYGYSSPEEMLEGVTDIASQIYAEPSARSQFTGLLMTDGSVTNFEMKNLRKDGSILWTSISARAVRDQGGKILYYEGFLQDITERKQVEAHMKDLFEFNEKMLNHSPLGILTYKVTGECVFANTNAACILGANVDELLNQNFHTLSSWKTSGLYDLADQAMTSHSPITADVYHQSTFGKNIWLRTYFVPFWANQEQHLFVSISDITKPKLDEDKLQESENQLILALSAAQINVWEWDLKTNHVLCSPEFYPIAGMTQTAIDGAVDGSADAHLIHPQDVARVRLAAEKALASNGMFAEEFRVIRPDGEVLWLANLGRAEYDPSGSSLRMIGTVQDITRRKQAEVERQALLEIMQGLAKTRDLQEFLSLIHRSIANVIYAENFFVVFYNKDTGLFEEMYSVDQFDPPAPPSTLEKSITSYVFRTAEPLLLDQKLFDELAARGEVDLIGTHSAAWLGVPLKTLNETIGVIVVQDYDDPNRYQEQDKNFLASIATQVALALERKQAEEKVRESEERFSNAFEFAPIGKGLFSLDGLCFKANRALCNLLGYTEPELTTMTFQEFTHPDDLDTDLNFVRQMISGEILSYQIEKRYFHKSGNIVWALLSVSMVKETNGKPSYFISQIEDITQRKYDEVEIDRRAKETSALLETSLALTNLDLKAILQNIGSSAKDLFAADGCRIFLVQTDGESLQCVLALQESPIFTQLKVNSGEGVIGSVAASGRGEIVNDMRNDRRAIQVPGVLEEDEAIMFAPLKERDRTIGILSIRRIGIDRPFHPADLEFLEAFASMAASAVSNARLFEETHRRLSELQALYENGLAVGQLLEPRQIGNRIIDTFARYLSWHHVAIRLLIPETDVLELIAFNQPGLREEEKIEVERHLTATINKVGQGLSGWVVQTGRAIRTGNVHEFPQYVSTYPGIQAGMYMPLRMGEQIIGVISVESEEPNALTAEDERLLATLANQATIAFENARLYQAAQQEIAERKLVEEELRESQERYRLLIETSPEGIVMMNLDGTIRFCNLQMAELFDFGTPSAVLGVNFASLISPDESIHYEPRPERYILDDSAQEGYWFTRNDGSRFFGELRSSTLRNEKGEPYAIIAQLRDVTERKQVQESLQEERQRFLDLFENSPIPTWLEDFTAVVDWMKGLREQGVKNLKEYLEINPDTYKIGINLIRVLNVNRAAVIANGAQNKQELLNNIHRLMLDRKPAHILIHEFELIWQGNTSFGFEMSSPRLDGTFISSILHVYVPHNNGRPDYARVIITSTDITDRVEFESRLRASELHYRELADSITDVLFELDHELRYTHWNKASESLVGIRAEEAIGKSLYDIFGASDEQIRIGKIYESVLEENQSKTFETELVLQGQKLVLEINANPSTRGVSVVARNITERKLSETLMQKRFELLEYSARHSFQEVLQKTIDTASGLAASPIGFLHFVAEDQMTITLQTWSTGTLQGFYGAEGLQYPWGQDGGWTDALRRRAPIIHNDYESSADCKGPPEAYPKVAREMVIPIIRNEKIVAVIGVGNKDKEYTRQDIEITQRFTDYAWDITERKQMESALAEERNQLAKRVEERTADLSRANSNLARALRVKDEFLANMSHELRTPLNAILGLSESLAEQVAGPLNEKQQKYLSTINESGHHLLSLINDILDLAKIEAGQITLDINRVDVNSVCQASLRMIKQLAQKKSQEVVFEIDSDIGLMWADERRLKQMIVNLLSNAVKFTPESSRIGLEVRGDRAANKVTITVWDTGIGIQEQDLERLFKPFVQLDSGLAREAQGTGLGLALVAQMARMHGGSVHALSTPGQGSRFIIQLPWEPAIASDIVAHLRNTGKFPAIDPHANRPTILLIEDTREVVMMLVDYLEMAGYRMVTAQDGIDGLEQVKLNPPDLILMDIQMPRMNGFETTQRLKSAQEFQNIPIIALTALAMPNDRQRCLEAGMDEYMSKPVNLKDLTKSIQKLLSRETARP